MNKLSLHHLVRKPAVVSEGSPPQLLLLHGIGSNEHDLMGLAPALDPRLLILSARAPITLQPGSYAWYHTEFTPSGFIIDHDEAEASRRHLLQFIDEVLEAYGGDPKRFFLGGFSQGAIMSTAAALTDPGKFAGIIAMSGRMLPGIEERMAPASQIRGLPFLVVHGTGDPVIKIEDGRALRQQLEALLVHLEYMEYPMAHNVSQDSLAHVARWLKTRIDAGDDWRNPPVT